ncbi:MAG: hypothetical protein S4CHLAM102_01540 [Chlamydiia bacterium]|nr:hypothetical protein [Chlamydiia bacterium]
MSVSAFDSASNEGLIDPVSKEYILNDPIQLGCGHTHNGATIHQWIRFQDTQKVSCPTCSCPITDAKKNEEVASKVEFFLKCHEDFPRERLPETSGGCEEVMTAVVAAKSRTEADLAGSVAERAQKFDLIDGVFPTEILDDPVQLGCNHTLNGKTIKRWIESPQSKQNCPICRAPIELAKRDIRVLSQVNIFSKLYGPIPEDMRTKLQTDCAALVLRVRELRTAREQRGQNDTRRVHIFTNGNQVFALGYSGDELSPEQRMLILHTMLNIARPHFEPREDLSQRQIDPDPTFSPCLCETITVIFKVTITIFLFVLALLGVAMVGMSQEMSAELALFFATLIVFPLTSLIWEN